MFGIGTELNESEWRGVARQLLAEGLLAVEGDYGTLVLTEASGEVLSRQRDVLLRRDPERAKSRSRSTSSSGGGKGKPAIELTGPAAGLFEQLRSWRAATRQGTGRAGVRDLPRRHAAPDRHQTPRPAWPSWATISGVGENKLAKYGEAILATIGAQD